MKDKVQSALKLIVSKHGLGILRERARLTGLLSDSIGSQTKETRAIGECVNLKICEGIIAETDPVEPASFIRWKRQLEEEIGLSEELAEWAVVTLAGICGKKIRGGTDTKTKKNNKQNKTRQPAPQQKTNSSSNNIPVLTKDPFETQEEYKARIESSGWLLCGHALLNKNDYNVESGVWKFQLIWQDWAKAIENINNYLLEIQIQRDEAKQIFSLHQTSGVQARIPLYCQIEVREKFVCFSKLILKTRETDYPIFRIEKTFKDIRDGKTYKVVKIGDQIWMAENLNYNINDSWYYDNNPQNGEKYGRLYTMETAMRAVPKGWHLPSKEEFEILLRNFGGEGEFAYKQLISGGKSGFDALLGGYRHSNGLLYHIGSDAFFWSSTELDKDSAWSLSVVSNNRKAYLYSYYNKYRGFNVRCIKD